MKALRILLFLIIVGLAGFWYFRTERPAPLEDAEVFSGYGEGELVYVAAPLGGALEKLEVRRGEELQAGAPLFTLEREEERAARSEAEEILAESRTTLEKAELDFKRAQSLRSKGVTTPEDFDTAQQTLLAARHRVAARKNGYAQADWRYQQKSQSAASAGLVYDTYHRPGEWVAAGAPVLSLLLPEYMKARFFVPETALGKLGPGTPVEILMDGRTEALPGQVSFVSPRAEYTLPIIYSRENRGKLVFLVEASLAPEFARLLHPGAPLEVRLAETQGPVTSTND